VDIQRRVQLGIAKHAVRDVSIDAAHAHLRRADEDFSAPVAVDNHIAVADDVAVVASTAIQPVHCVIVYIIEFVAIQAIVTVVAVQYILPATAA